MMSRYELARHLVGDTRAFKRAAGASAVQLPDRESADFLVRIGARTVGRVPILPAGATT